MPFNLHLIKDEEGQQIWDNALFWERWVGPFYYLLSTKSPILEATIVGELKTPPPPRPLDDVPYRYEVKQAILALTSRKAA